MNASVHPPACDQQPSSGDEVAGVAAASHTHKQEAVQRNLKWRSQPDDVHPTHGFVAVEGQAADPCLQVVGLRADPIRRGQRRHTGLLDQDR
jgi:hypothetical protein